MDQSIHMFLFKLASLIRSWGLTDAHSRLIFSCSRFDSTTVHLHKSRSLPRSHFDGMNHLRQLPLLFQFEPDCLRFMPIYTPI